MTPEELQPLIGEYILFEGRFSGDLWYGMVSDLTSSYGTKLDQVWIEEMHICTSSWFVLPAFRRTRISGQVFYALAISDPGVFTCSDISLIAVNPQEKERQQLCLSRLGKEFPLSQER